MKKRIVSLLLVLCMIFTLVPAYALTDGEKTAGTAAGQTQTAAPSGGQESPFADVKPGDWCYEAVLYARANGFFNGTTPTTFEPNGTLTRGMFVTVLGRMAGADASAYQGDTGFTDVKAGSYCAPYVKWAAKHGITGGTGNGAFSPNAPVTRQQMAAFLVRYFEAFSVRYETGADVAAQPADLDAVAGYAKDAVLKLWKQGLLNGDGVNFNPAGNATRAQTAAVCMRTDKTVDTWYSEPGVPSARVSVDPAAAGPGTPEQKPAAGGSSSTGGSSGGSSGGGGGGGTVTSHYQVTFALGDGMSAEGVTLPQNKTYAKDTKLSGLPAPYLKSGLFAGWYYDAALTKAVGAEDTLTRNLTLYAKLDNSGAAAQVGRIVTEEVPNYVTVTVKSGEVSGWTFRIENYQEGCIESFVNLTAGNADVVFTVDNGGTVRFQPEQGQTYRVELAEDSAACFVADGLQPQSVRVLNIITEKGQVDNLKLDGGLKFIPRGDVGNMAALDGLFTAALAENGKTTQIQKVSKTGTFTYTGSEKLSVGDTAAIYEGLRPDLRKDSTLNTADDGGIAYVEITGVSGDTYTYKTADTEDVLFTPDVLPVSADADKDTTDGNILTVDKAVMEFTDDKYAAMGLDSQTTVDVGDFLALYTGTLGGDAGQESGLTAVYGQITGVSFNEETEEYTIAYTPVEESAIRAAMDVYQTREEKAPELTARQIRSMEADMERQALESGFAEQAAQYLAGLAVETDGFRELSDDLDMDLASYSLTYADGTPVQQGDMALMAGGNRVLFDKNKLKVEAKINAGSLTHFDGSYGLRAELTVSFTVEIESKLHAGDKLVIEVKAVFEQEILLSVNTSGGAIWKKAWIFPYIADYQLNANLDLGTYTGVGVTATARTAAEEDDKDPFKDVTGEGAAGKVKNIGQQILQLMEDKEHFLGEDIDMNTVGGGLADKYSSMMEDAEENWIELFRKEIYSKEGPVDRLHILVYGISADFVVSASLYVTLGMSFEYEAAKRYTFSIKLFSRDVTSGAVDLVTPHYNFDFYVMGTAGIRAGVEFEIGVGLFSLKLDSIGITAEAGVYARMWGYFYYHLEWTKGQDKKSEASGALFVEIGMYLLVTFKAQLFSSDKLTYQPTLYENEWPLWSAGAQKNVYDFAYDDDDPQLNVEMQSVRTAALPSSLFDMNYMDMKTGDLYGTDADDEDENPAGNFDDASESNYIVELSDPDKFHYDPAANTITVTPGSGSVSESCEMKLTWKNGRLAFTSKPIERTVTVEWTDPANARFIAFNSMGGSMVKTLTMAAGDTVTRPADPTKVGYIFAGWYEDESRTKPFAFPSTMPDYWAESGEQYKGVTVYAKWTPRTDTKYTVEHYLQSLNGTYTLTDTDHMTGTTDAPTAAEPKTAGEYAHYTNRIFAQKDIAPDGSTVVRIYYTRDKYTVTFKRTDDAPQDEWLTVTGRYGATVYAPRLARDGYDFAGFSGLTPDANGNYMITDLSADAAYVAQWTPRNDTAYRVEHYVERIGSEGWLLYSGEGAVQYRYDGKTDEQAAVDDSFKLSISGLIYHHSSADGGQPISADGKTVIKLYYTRRSYTVSFDAKEGALTGAASQQCVYGGRVVKPASPTRSGYAFDGWYYDNGGVETAYDFNTGVTGDLTLYARWTANGDTAYTVEHYQQNADGTYPDKPTETESLTGATDASVTAAAKPYDHFTLNAEKSNQTGTVTADGSLVLKLYYDRMEYTAVFKQDGTELKTETARWGAAITPPEATVPDGYTLSWSPALSDPPVMPAEDTVYTAVLTAKGGIAYTVNHHQQNADNDGYTLTDKDSLTGATDASVTAVEKSYDHFTLNEEKSVKTGTITADGRLTLDLYYDRDTVTVTFDPNGGALDGENGPVEKPLRWGASLRDIKPEWDDDHGFAGWYADTEYATQVTTADDANVLLYAKWNLGEVGFTVEYYVMDTDGQYPAEPTDKNTTMTGAVDTSVSIASLGRTDLGEAFACDAGKTACDGGTVTGDSVTVSKGMTVKLYYTRAQYALTWAMGEDCTVTNESGYTRAGQVYYDAPITRPELSRTGWHYTWTNEPADRMPAADTEYTAEWALNAYTVRFDANGGDGTMTDQRFTYDTAQALTTNAFTRAGYTFGGWNTAADGSGTTYADGAEVTNLTAENNGTVILYAQWKAAQCTIYFNTKGGTEVGPLQVKVGSPYYLIIDEHQLVNYGYGSERTGYTFKQWCTDEACTQPVETAHLFNEDTTLYAEWTLVQYDISFRFRDEGGAFPEGTEVPSTYTVEDEFDLPTPVKKGYIFRGWYLDIAFQNGPYTRLELGSTTHRQYRPKWEAEASEITFEDPSGVLGSVPEILVYTAGTTTLTDGTVKDSSNAFLYWYTTDGGTETPLYTVPRGTVGKLTVYPKVIDRSITGPEQLAALAACYQYKSAQSGAQFTLGSDITLENWSTPIGTADHPFDRTFSGSSGKYITLSGTAQPLFGVVDKSGKVADLTVYLSNVTASPAQGFSSWGAVTCRNHGTVEGCTVYGEVTGDSSLSAIGGIAGINTREDYTYDDPGSIVNCGAGIGANEGERLVISFTGSDGAEAGGLVGRNVGIVTLDAALKHYVTITTNACDVGGLIGMVDRREERKPITVTGNEIDAVITQTASSGSPLESGIGGLIGRIYGVSTDTSESTVECSNTTITCVLKVESWDSAPVGGVVGLMSGVVSSPIKIVGTGNTVTGTITCPSASVGKITGYMRNGVHMNGTALSSGTDIDAAASGWDTSGLTGPAHDVGGSST